jgi:tetratricopeptide (TPR) repeat protein
MNPPRWLVLFILVIVFSSCNFTSADTYLQQSKLAIEKEDYRSAINLLTKAIHKDPQLKDAYLQRGLCFQNLSNKDSAIHDFEKLLSFDPKNTCAWYYAGLCQYSQNKFNEAIESYNQALITKGITNPVDTSANRVIVADTNATVGSCKVLPVQLYYQRGLAYYAAHQPQKAYRDFQTCIVQKYNLDECFYLSSICWLAGNTNNTPCDTFKLNSAQGKNMAKNHLAHLCK